MSDWNPALYMRFASERTRPAAELMARIPFIDAQVQHVVDLGCGPGNSTQLLLSRFSEAQVLGIDNSQSMLAAASENVPQAKFLEADIAQWQPDVRAQSPQLIFANAALHWVPDHEALIPRLFSLLAAGGVLAIQVPDNDEEASHVIMREVAELSQFAQERTKSTAPRSKILLPREYYDLLASVGAQSIDIWHTVYQHRMESPAAIVEWLRSTGLRTYVESLPARLQTAYLAEYEKRVDQAYPPLADGSRLLAFPRLFIVAQRSV